MQERISIQVQLGEPINLLLTLPYQQAKSISLLTNESNT